MEAIARHGHSGKRNSHAGHSSRRTAGRQRALNHDIITLYRVMLVVWQLGWVEIDLGYYTTCWAAGVMAEWAEPVSRLVELENLSQHNQLPDHQHHPVVGEYLSGPCRL